MPVYAMGVNEHETPFSFGNVVPPLQFHWSVNNDRIPLKPTFHKVTTQLSLLIVLTVLKITGNGISTDEMGKK